MSLNQIDYNSWVAEVVAATATTLTVQPVEVTITGGKMIIPWNTNASLLIAGGTAIAETVTPTVIDYSSVAGAVVLTFASLAHTHGFGDSVASGTLGLQEFVNAQSASPQPPQSIFDASQFGGAAVGTERLVDSELTLNHAGSVTVSGSAVAVRGNTTVANGTTIAAGYVYGVQGKLSIKGTFSTANYSAGVVGQLDLSAATAVSGNVNIAWLDAGASSAVALTSVSALTITNTIANKPMHAIINVPLADAAVFADLNDSGDSPWAGADATGKTFSNKGIKVLVGGVAYFIPLYS